MITFYEWLNEELLRSIDLSRAIYRSGIDPSILHSAHKLLTANDFLENPPPEAKGAYSLGLTTAGGVKGIYFHIADSLGLVKWPDAYKKVFGPDWSKMNWSQQDITDQFLNKILEDNQKYIVFFLPNDALNKGRFTKEEMEFFIRNPDKLKRVIFVLGAYDIVDEKDYQQLVVTGRTQPQRKALTQDVLQNPTQHKKPGDPI